MVCGCRAAPGREIIAVLLLAVGLSACARGVNDYLAEARSNAPGAVKEAVIAIGEVLLRKQAASLPFDDADREAILYLKEAAEKNPVPINRAVALAALGRLRAVEAAETFLAALQDPFWLARLEAVRALAAEPHDRFAEPLRELLSRETRPEVRLGIVKALREIKGPVALRTLLEVFLERGDGVRDTQVHAYSGIQEMTGLSHGFDELRSWDEYYRQSFGSRPTGGETAGGGVGPRRSPPPGRSAGQ